MLLRGLMVCLCAGLGLSERAEAACTILGVGFVTPSTVNTANYTISSIPGAVTVNLAVGLTVSLTGTGGTCTGGVVVLRSTAPAQMAHLPAVGGAVPLPYDVISGATSVITYGAVGLTTPTRGIAVPAFVVTVAGPGVQTVSKQITLTVLPLTPTGMPTTGFHTDQLLQLAAYDTSLSLGAKGSPKTLAVAANVDPGCDLIAPSALSLEFTSDIVSGRPAGVAKTLTYALKCNALARIMTTGSALVPTPARAPVSGFDNLINYHSLVTMTGASAAMTTTGITPVTTVSSTQILAPGNPLLVQVKVTLTPALPLQPGTYKSVLRVIVDPAL
jgi:hypothetical protein